MYITLTGALASIATNLVLVPHIGITGAGWAIFTSYVVMALCLFVFLQRNYPIKYQYKKLSLMAACAVLALLVNMFAKQLPQAQDLAVKIIVLCIYPCVVFAVLKLVKDGKNKLFKP